MVVSRAVNENLANYASRKLWVPLEAETDALWSLDRTDGIEKAYCCFNARARDFARIGELVRLGGQWGQNRVVDPEYIREMTRPHGVLNSEEKPVDYYGFQWWVLKTPEGEVPYARGILGQYIAVIPSKKRVVVRLGKKTGERTDHHPVELRALVEWASRS
jgi:CubicO group peptidase (beta-lactamase class C family)